MNAILKCIACGWVIFFTTVTLCAQPYYSRPETQGLEPLQSLSGTWLDEEFHLCQVPFWDSTAAPHLLSRRFTLSPQPAEPLWLAFEGVAWNASITLNGRLLCLISDPFAFTLVPLDPSWLTTEGSNLLEVEMNAEGPLREWYPERFTGIFRPVWLLHGPLRAGPAPQALPADKVLVLAAWSELHGPMDDSLRFEQMLGEIAASGQHAVVPAFAFSSQQLAQLGAHHLSLAAPPDEWDQLAFYNYWPARRASLHSATPFWTVAGRRSQFFGHYVPMERLQRAPAQPLNHLAVFFFIALPVLGMALMRAASERIYDSLIQFLTKPKIFLEMITSSKFMGQWESWLMNLFRIALSALFTALVLYYVTLYHQWGRVNLLSSESLVYQFLSSGYASLYYLFLMAMLWLVVINLVKHLVLSFAGQVFRGGTLNSTVVSLDIFASFPLNLLMLVPAVFLFFADAGWEVVPVVTLCGLYGLFVLRRLVTLYQGLGRVAGVSGSAKILYICAFEILPWLILF